MICIRRPYSQLQSMFIRVNLLASNRLRQTKCIGEANKKEEKSGNK